MNLDSISDEALVQEFFNRFFWKKSNILEIASTQWNSHLKVRFEDEEDGSEEIYHVNFDYRGLALDKTGFRVEEKESGRG